VGATSDGKTLILKIAEPGEGKEAFAQIRRAPKAFNDLRDTNHLQGRCVYREFRQHPQGMPFAVIRGYRRLPRSGTILGIRTDVGALPRARVKQREG
jgi:hypothetical protein